MKKTGTTIFTLALAMILVSTLSSGVILADDDDDDNRRKNRNKYETVRDVAILTCVISPVAPFAPLIFSSFDGPEEVEMQIDPGSCAAAEAIVLNERFKFKDLSTGIFAPLGGFSAVVRLSTFVKSTRVEIED